MGKVGVEPLHYLVWTVKWREAQDAHASLTALATPAPALTAEGLPAEVGLLLPNRNSQSAELDLATEISKWDSDRPGLGLFLANPFFGLNSVAEACQAGSIEWVVNLPSVAQQDLEFGQQLEDVDLDLGGELRRLEALRERGLRIAATVTDADGALKAAAMQVEVLIVLPRISDFAVGFPSSRQRGAVIQQIRAALSDTDWQGAILGLGDETEAAHPALWPEGADGLLVRPKARK